MCCDQTNSDICDFSKDFLDTYKTPSAMVVPMAKDIQKETESLESAALRLLQRLKRAEKKASGRLEIPNKFQIGQRPLADKEAGEAAAISASFTGQTRRLGDGKAVVILAANDNRPWMSRGNGDASGAVRVLNGCASPAPNSDDNAAPKIARIVTLRGSGEF
jgi:hypothetical protein